MLDAKMIRSNPDILRTALENRQADTSPLDEFLSLDESRRKLLAEVESLKAERNKVSEAIAVMKKEKKDASAEIERMRGVGDKIKELDAEVRDIEEKLETILLNVPNIPSDTVPVGKDASDNVIVREWGEKRQFDFEPIPHWELATALDILDFERGSKLGGSGFILYKGLGARLERALINWMIDLHVQEDGYTEVFPPFVVNRKTITGTGQVPKFEFDMYRLPDDDMFLIPTAEVPVTNIFADEILEGDRLPIRYTAYTPCFRREAGSAGKDTRGLLRVHQFDKVEMVNWTKPEESYDALETMTNAAEKVFKLLDIPYRIVLLCTGDMGFSAAKTYDVEVWAPGVGTWLEVSSCSNCEDFQARRANIRFRRAAGEKPEFVHTLNGSGVALPRTVVAIMENYQQPDGTIIVPEVLKPYMGTDVIK